MQSGGDAPAPLAAQTILLGQPPPTLSRLQNVSVASQVTAPGVPVPAGVTRGQYNVEVYLFRDGEVVSAQSTPLFVDQQGLERKLFNMAHHAPLFYGLLCVFMAMLLGWISSVLFRRPA